MQSASCYSLLLCNYVTLNVFDAIYNPSKSEVGGLSSICERESSLTHRHKQITKVNGNVIT